MMAESALVPKEAWGQPPAVIAKLTGRTSSIVPATLFDLAQRGLVQIEAKPGTPPNPKQFSLCRQLKARSQLSRYEQDFLEAVFQTDSPVPLPQVAPRLAWAAGALDQALEVEMVTAGWLDPRRQQRRDQWLAFSVTAALAGAVILIAGLTLGIAVRGELLAMAWRPASAIGAVVLLSIGAIALALSLMALLGSSTLTPLSAQGQLAAAQWKNFAAYLKAVTQGQAPPPSLTPFDQYLPIAAAFGLAEAWARYFQQQGELPQLEWYRALDATADAGDFGAIAALLTTIDLSIAVGDGFAVPYGEIV